MKVKTKKQFKTVKDFRDNALLPFLMKNTAVEIFNNHDLLKQFCKHYEYKVKEVLDMQSVERKKMIDYLTKTRYLHKGSKYDSVFIEIEDPDNPIEKELDMIVSTIEERETTEIIKIKSPKAERLIYVPNDKPIDTKLNNENENENLAQDKENSSAEKKKEIVRMYEKVLLPKTEYRKIKKIQYASPTTRAASEKIESQTKLQKEMLQDYIYYLNGGQDLVAIETQTVMQANGEKVSQVVHRKRCQFPSIQLKNSFMLKLQDDEKISPEEVKKTSQLYNLLVSMENAPLKYINTMAEGGFAMQKELQGVIFNDKELIESGIVEIEKNDTTDFKAIQEVANDVMKYANQEDFNNIVDKLKEM